MDPYTALNAKLDLIPSLAKQIAETEVLIRRVFRHNRRHRPIGYFWVELPDHPDITEPVVALWDGSGWHLSRHFIPVVDSQVQVLSDRLELLQ